MNKYNYDKVKSDVFKRVSDIITAINKGDTDELESLLCSSLYASQKDIPSIPWYTRTSDTEFLYRGKHFVLVYIEELHITVTFIKEDFEGDNVQKLIVPYLWVYGFPDDLFNNVLNSSLEHKLNLDKWIDTL